MFVLITVYMHVCGSELQVCYILMSFHNDHHTHRAKMDGGQLTLVDIIHNTQYTCTLAILYCLKN